MPDIKAGVTLHFHDRFSRGLMRAAQRVENWGRTVAGAAGTVDDAWKRVDLAADVGELAGQVGALTDRLRRLADQPVAVAAAVQKAEARIKTVLSADDIADGAEQRIKAVADAHALARTEAGRLASLTAEDFIASVYTGKGGGLTVDQSIAAAGQSALLAQAGGSSREAASGALISQFTIFGDKEAEIEAEMARISDSMAAAQNFFRIEGLQQLTDGLANVSGMAAGFGVPFEQVNAVLGLLNTMGVEGPEAGTAMKASIEFMAKAAEDLGFTIAATADGGLDFAATMRTIADSGFSAEQLTEAFGSEAGPAIIHLTSQLQLFQDGLAGVRQGQGMTAKNAATMADTYDAARQRLAASAEVLQERFGASGLAIRTFGANAAQTGAQALAWASGLPGVGAAVTGLAGGITEIGAGAAGAFGGVLELSTGLLSFSTLVGKNGPLRKAIPGLVKGISSGASSMLRAVPAAIAWASANWAALAPILAVVAGVAVVAAGVYLLIKNWSAVKGFFVGVWNGVKAAFSSAWDWIKAAVAKWYPYILGVFFGPLGLGVGLVIKHWDAIKAFFSGLWSSLKTQFAAGWTGLRDTVLSGLRAIVNLIGNAGRAIAGFFTGIWDRVTGVFEAAWEKIAGDGTLIGRIFGTQGKSAQQYGSEVGDAMEDALEHGVEPRMPSSDAERGPLSRLTESGRAIPRTLAAGVLQETQALPDAIQRVVRLPPAAALPDETPAAVEPAAHPRLAADVLDETPTAVEQAVHPRLAAGVLDEAPAAVEQVVHPRLAADVLDQAPAAVEQVILPRLAGDALGESGALAETVDQSVRLPGLNAPAAADQPPWDDLITAMRDLIRELRTARQRRRPADDPDTAAESHALLADLGWAAGIAHV